jgi:uncharacterized membrane protein
MSEQITPSRTRDIGRLNAFTDGLVVVSMTLLVLDIRLSEHVSNHDSTALLQALIGLWPKFFAYIISFFVIAQYWIGYTEKFGSMRSADTGFAWLNIVFLFLIGFIPFVTTLIGGNAGALATQLYAATMVAISIVLCFMWFYATKHGFVGTDSDRNWRSIAGWLQIGIVFGLSIIVAAFSPFVAKLSWLLLAVPLPKVARTSS